jgi:hypothetical protein
MENMKDGEYQLLEAEKFTNLSYLPSGHTKYKPGAAPRTDEGVQLHTLKC